MAPRFRDVSDQYCQNCNGVGVFRSAEWSGDYDRETGTPYYIEHEDPCPACGGTGKQEDAEKRRRLDAADKDEGP